MRKRRSTWAGGRLQLGEVGLEHRQVELGAVEGDQEVELGENLGKLLQIKALDELAHILAVVEARHRHQQPRPGFAVGLDVEIGGAGPELAEEAPVLPGLEPGGEIGGVLGVVQGPGEFGFQPVQPAPGQALDPFGGQKILPGGQPLAPEMRLPPGPHPGQVNESAF